MLVSPILSPEFSLQHFFQKISTTQPMQGEGRRNSKQVTWVSILIVYLSQRKTERASFPLSLFLYPAKQVNQSSVDVS
jgi:hypothetical protein